AFRRTLPPCAATVNSVSSSSTTPTAASNSKLHPANLNPIFTIQTRFSVRFSELSRLSGWENPKGKELLPLLPPHLRRRNLKEPQGATPSRWLPRRITSPATSSASRGRMIG
ncbi:hypothetical protein LINPERHAP1_LOCUS15379, partial [Linum perenne]